MNEQFQNVKESWPIYDTVLMCKEFYGKEKSITGWFTSFADFAAEERHTFFKNRTAGNSHLAYTNLDSADNIDFAFIAWSFGVRFFAPVVPDVFYDGQGDPAIRAMQEGLNAFWLFDLPRHAGIELKVQQDTVIENNCMATPPGYGPRGGGGSQPIAHLDTGGQAPPIPTQDPWQVTVGSQGEPCIDCRFPLPGSIRIARNTPIEATLHIGMYARDVLAPLYNNGWELLTGNFGSDPAINVYQSLPSRWGIQVSLFGHREVQQRGQLHAN